MRQLEDALNQLTLDGTLYIGYPILASADEATVVEVLLITEQHGLIAFTLNEKEESESAEDFLARIQDDQYRLYYSLTSNLSRHQGLRKGKGLAFDIKVITFVPPGLTIKAEGYDVTIVDQSTVCQTISTLGAIEQGYYSSLNAAIQRVTTIKPAKRRASVSRSESKGGVLKQIEMKMANLDQWQKRGAIEQPEGMQRIRGLAGSGKTIALALKAAYLHSQYPDWDIAVVFFTRSLYQQFRDLIWRFTFAHLNDEPNFEKLRILHAWGSYNKMGAYSEMARSVGVVPRDYRYARGTYGMQNAFNGICQELYSEVKGLRIKPLYDAVLIDEAQDLPTSFFTVIELFVREPKRIVFAYDELQSLSESSMIPVAEYLAEKIPESDGNEPMRDIVLPVCYRNAPWTIALAHALGLGIYRQDGMVQFFENPEIMRDVGYEVISGALSPGSKVGLRRSDQSCPGYFKDLLNKEDAISAKCCDDEHEQAEYVAQDIKHNLEQDELDCDDILIVLPDAMHAKSQAGVIMDALAKCDIRSHVAGVTYSQDILFEENSIAIANIYRAKGNEAPLVYVVNSDYCFGGREQIRKRNILFTAITRAKAWVKLFGCGSGMEGLCSEIDEIKKNDYTLEFTVPTTRELKNMRRIHRELSQREKKTIKGAEKGLRDFIKAVENNIIEFETLPAEDREKLAKFLKRAEEDEGF